MTYAEAIAEIQQMVDEGQPYDVVLDAITRHAHAGTILVDDVEICVDGKPVPSFTLELGGNA